MVGLISLAPGCAPDVPPATIAAPTAPLRPTLTKVETLPEVKFIDITKEAGISFVHTNGATGKKLLPETMGSGVAFLDYDSDGDQDLVFVNSDHWPDSDAESASKPTQALYRNDGKGHFEDATKAAGLDKTYFGMGVAVGDYDNDGDPDLYITAVGGGHLYRNDGGKFVDVTVETKTRASDGWLTSAVFVDVENDGDLDLFVCCYVKWDRETDSSQDFQLKGSGRAYGPPTAFNGAFCTLLRNDGGSFTDISEDSGIQVRTPDLKVPLGKSLAVAPFDVDGDGLVDLAIANDTVPNFFFRNLGDCKFEETGIISGIAFDQSGSARGAMGIDWADFKNDGTLGLAIGNFANEMMALYVTDEPKALQFSDLANIHGLGAPTQPPLKFGLFFLDYDLDGRLDLLSTNGHLESDIEKVQASETYAQSAQLFWNTGKRKGSLFALATDQSIGPDLYVPIVGRGSAYADIDGDGDLDVVFTANGGPARLFRNEGGSKNHWIRFVLSGNPSNRSAIGAKVSFESGGKVQTRQLFNAKGYLSTTELPLTFGLGPDETMGVLKIKWPSGKLTELEFLSADKVHKIDETKGIVKD